VLKRLDKGKRSTRARKSPRAKRADRLRKGDASLKPDIDFFLIGAAKCGTTSVYRTFSRHPDIYVPPIKEPRFLCGSNLKKGWRWYARNWKKQPAGTITGDFSPSYSVSLSASAPAPRRIAQHYPNAKIIYVVRDPVAAAISNWRMATAKSKEGLSFAEAVRAWPSVGQRMKFWSQISLYRKYFPDSQIRVIVVEEITRNPARMREIFKWLGVRSEGRDIPRFATANKSSARINRPPRPSIPTEDRQWFLAQMKDEARAILDYAGVRRSVWKLTTRSKAWMSEKELAAQKERQNKIRKGLAWIVPAPVQRFVQRTVKPAQHLKCLVLVRAPRKLARLVGIKTEPRR